MWGALCATPDGESVVLPWWWGPTIAQPSGVALTNPLVRVLAGGAACEGAGVGLGRLYTAAKVFDSFPKSYITRHAFAPFLPLSALLLGAPRLGFAH